MVLPKPDGAAAVAINTKLLVALFASVLFVAPAFAFDVRPDPNKTGGSVRPDGNDPKLVCNATGTRGPMPPARRDRILQSYGLPPGYHPDYEIDHLVPLCLGGADDDSNLWPQPRRTIEPQWNAERKDALERELCRLVCDKLLELGDAQEAIIKDWIAAYHLYYEH